MHCSCLDTAELWMWDGASWLLLTCAHSVGLCAGQSCHVPVPLTGCTGMSRRGCQLPIHLDQRTSMPFFEQLRCALQEIDQQDLLVCVSLIWLTIMLGSPRSVQRWATGERTCGRSDLSLASPNSASQQTLESSELQRCGLRRCRPGTHK